MRKRFFWSPTGANQRWPAGDSVGAPGHAVPFNWLKIDNRGAGAVNVFLDNGPASNDQMLYYMAVASGKVRVVNLAGPHDDPDAGDAWPRDLTLIAQGATTCMIEISDHEITDIDQTI